ncbi:MAG: membrane dipeptidase [Bacteroidales bacterium]|nr:membrane dipeptidase [Bacteroidales bacterium]
MKKLSTFSILAAIALLIGSFSSCKQESIEEKAARIHDQVYTVDSHNDTPMRFSDSTYNMSERHDSRKGGGKVDFARMKEGGLDGAFFAVFVGQGPLTEEGRASVYQRTMRIFRSVERTIEENSAVCGLALSPEDGYRLEKEGKRAVFIGIENGYPIGTDIRRVEEFYNLGARYITLSHSRNNDICDSSTDKAGPLHNGLSDFGRDVVKEINRLGIMVDVSHISDKSFYDVIETSQVPVIASHSCARALCDNPRNLDDEMLRTLADNGGVIQMCILSAYLKNPEPNPERQAAEALFNEKYNNWEGLTDEELKQARREYSLLRRQFPDKLATVSDMVDHIDHVVEVAGIDHIGVGTDFDGGGDLQDCFDVSEMGNITLELVKRGYSQKEIKKIWGGNLFRVMQEVQDFAAKQAQAGN